MQVKNISLARFTRKKRVLRLYSLSFTPCFFFKRKSLWEIPLEVEAMPILVKQQSIPLIVFPVMWASLIITAAKTSKSGMRKKTVSYWEISTIERFPEKSYIVSVYTGWHSVAFDSKKIFFVEKIIGVFTFKSIMNYFWLNCFLLKIFDVDFYKNS